MFNIQFQKQQLLNFIVYIAIFLFAIIRPLELYPDSLGYLKMSIYRSPVYPIFLNLFSWMDSSFYDLTLISFQSLLGILAIHKLMRTIKANIKMPIVFYFLILILFAAPYFYNQNVANRMLSEGLAYPLFLLSISFLIDLNFTFTKQKLIKSAIILCLLILTRHQFIHLLLIAILITISQKNIASRVKILGVGAFLTIPILTFVIDSTYHYLKHDYFVQTPWTGIAIISPALYVSDNHDVKIYRDSNEIKFFSYVDSRLNEKGLKQSNLKQDVDYYAFFNKNYTEIANHTVFDDGRKLFNNGIENDIQFIEIDRMTKKMTLPLIKDNFKKWSVLYFRNFINAYGSSKNFILYAIIFLTAAIGFLKFRDNHLKLIALMLLASFLNSALVAFGIHTVKRYTFYYDWVIFLVIFMMISYALGTLSLNHNNGLGKKIN